MTQAIADRCGYETENLPSSAGENSLGNICCWRPTWGERDKCIWHANEDNKPIEKLREARTGRLERLDGSYLAGTSLADISFEDCILRNSNLSAVSIEDSNFTNANLSCSVLDYARIKNTKFVNANLSSSTFQDMKAESSNFKKADLSGSKIVGKNTDVVFWDSNLEKINLSQTKIEGADFAELSMTECSLRDAEVSANSTFAGCDLAKATLDRIEAFELDLAEVDLSQASLNEAILDYGDFSNADLSSVSARESSLYGTQCSEADFSDGTLEDVDLSDADLTGTNFTGANLRGALLNSSDCTGANFAKAQLGGADLIDTDFTDAKLWLTRVPPSSLSAAELAGSSYRWYLILRAKSVSTNIIRGVLGGVSAALVVNSIGGAVLAEFLSTSQNDVIVFVNQISTVIVPVLQPILKPGVVVGLAGLIFTIYNVYDNKQEQILQQTVRVNRKLNSIRDDLDQIKDE